MENWAYTVNSRKKYPIQSHRQVLSKCSENWSSSRSQDKSSLSVDPVATRLGLFKISLICERPVKTAWDNMRRFQERMQGLERIIQETLQAAKRCTVCESRPPSQPKEPLRQIYPPRRELAERICSGVERLKKMADNRV